MNTRRTTLIILIVFGLLGGQILGQTAGQSVLRIESKLNDEVFISTVFEEDLQTMPKWSESVEWPALSPRKAIRSARTVAEGKSKIVDWHLQKISLIPVGDPGNWVYLVEFRPLPRGIPVNGFVSSFQIIVLLDGRAITPNRK